MKYIYLLLISLSIFSCDKEKCYTIEGKEIINGDYYVTNNKTLETLDTSTEVGGKLIEIPHTKNISKILNIRKITLVLQASHI